MGRFHEWKGRKQPETEGYPFDNTPPFLDPQTGLPVFPAGITPPPEAPDAEPTAETKPAKTSEKK